MVSDDDDICALLEKRELLADVVNMLSEWHEPEMQVQYDVPQESIGFVVSQ